MTHTASVAALADQHLVVDKASAEARAAAAADAIADSATPRDADDWSSVAWRSRRHGGFGDGSRGLSVTINEVRGREREEEVARMAAGDMGGGAASELAREMLRYHRRQGLPAVDALPPVRGT